MGGVVVPPIDKNFNSHPPAEGDAQFLFLTVVDLDFNSHPPAEGDFSLSMCLTPIVRFQLTPSRGGRLYFFTVLMILRNISTHTLPRRATGIRHNLRTT